MKVDREKQLIFKEEELEVILSVNHHHLLSVTVSDFSYLLTTTLKDIDIDELREALPEHQPRFLVYSFKLDHGDGRISYPMCFIFSSPQGSLVIYLIPNHKLLIFHSIDSKTELQMMYAGSKLELVKVAELTKVFEIRELEELTEEWLHSKLLK